MNTYESMETPEPVTAREKTTNEPIAPNGTKRKTEEKPATQEAKEKPPLEPIAPNESIQATKFFQDDWKNKLAKIEIKDAFTDFTLEAHAIGISVEDAMKFVAKGDIVALDRYLSELGSGYSGHTARNYRLVFWFVQTYPQILLIFSANFNLHADLLQILFENEPNLWQVSEDTWVFLPRIIGGNQFFLNEEKFTLEVKKLFFKARNAEERRQILAHVYEQFPPINNEDIEITFSTNLIQDNNDTNDNIREDTTDTEGDSSVNNDTNKMNEMIYDKAEVAPIDTNYVEEETTDNAAVASADFSGEATTDNAVDSVGSISAAGESTLLFFFTQVGTEGDPNNCSEEETTDNAPTDNAGVASIVNTEGNGSSVGEESTDNEEDSSANSEGDDSGDESTETTETIETTNENAGVAYGTGDATGGATNRSCFKTFLLDSCGSCTKSFFLECMSAICQGLCGLCRSN